MRGLNRPEQTTCTMEDCWWDDRGAKFDPHTAVDISTVMIVKAKYIEADSSMY